MNRKVMIGAVLFGALAGALGMAVTATVVGGGLFLVGLIGAGWAKGLVIGVTAGGAVVGAGVGLLQGTLVSAMVEDFKYR